MWTRKKLEKENIIKQKEQVRGRAGGSFEPVTNRGYVEVLSNHLSC